MKIVHNPEAKLISFLDEHYYTFYSKTYYLSSTTILDVYPKGYGYIQWLKSFGVNADQIMKQAGEQGSKIHDAIDRFLKGEEIKWINEDNEINYTVEEWIMLMRFFDFWTKYKPKVIAQEQSLLSEKLGFGGTADLVCEMNNEIWLIDYKSTNGIYKSHELQVASYAMLWNNTVKEHKIQKTGIMWLKALTRGEDKLKKKIQGEGWILKEFDRSYEEAYRFFEHAKEIWYEENPNYKPKNLIYPDSIKLNEKN